MKKIILFVISFSLIFSFVNALDPNAFDFVVYGDSHAGYEGNPPEIPPSETIHQTIVDRILTIDPDLILHTGDYTHVELEESCQLHYDIAHRLIDEYDYYLTAGNHDEEDRCTSNSRYYFTKKQALFISLPVPRYTDTLSQENYNWLKAVLNANKGKRWKFVFFHNPPYTKGMRGCAEGIRGQIHDLLNNYAVDIVFNGHTHAYERFKVDRINYVVTGGAGGVPHTLDGDCDIPVGALKDSKEGYNYVYVKPKTDSLTLKAYELDGSLIDSFTIVKPPKEPQIMISEIEHPGGLDKESTSSSSGGSSSSNKKIQEAVPMEIISETEESTENKKIQESIVDSATVSGKISAVSAMVTYFYRNPQKINLVGFFRGFFD